MSEHNERDGVERLRRWVDSCDNIVFFGGAGVSTESGIPDFRSEDGLYRQHYDWPPETILSAGFFAAHPEEFYRFYREKMLVTGAQPCPAHLALAELERRGKLRAVITQNIDGLHQKAGSRRVYELHGTIYQNRCLSCGALCGPEGLGESGLPRCRCGGLIKPEVVLYGESLDGATLQGAVDAISRCEMLIVGGTSLAVYPAAGLLQYYRGRRLVLINRSPTPQDDRADLLLRGSIGPILTEAIPPWAGRRPCLLYTSRCV